MTTYRILEQRTGFIVQEVLFEGFRGIHPRYRLDVKDLKEFTSIEEARAYKHNLELEEGIVRD